MGVWHVPADLLAQARFLVSPKAEVTGALAALLQPQDPTERGFHSAHGQAFAQMLHEHPARAHVLDASFRPRSPTRAGWVAHYLALPPRIAGVTIGEEIALVTEIAETSLREDLEVTSGRPFPAGDFSAVTAAAELIEWVWTHTLATDWPRRQRTLEADVVARTSQLARRGWAEVLQGLGKDREWLADGRLQINRYDLPHRTLPADADLCFVPVLATASWVGWDDEGRHAVYYPVVGRLASAGDDSTGGLDRLIGANRALLLRLLDSPTSTSGLAAQTDLPLGSVGDHLAVLLRAGAVLRRRSARSVLYWRSPLGDGLVAADGSRSRLPVSGGAPSTPAAVSRTTARRQR